MTRISRKGKKTAKKTPRYANYKRRAASKNKAERILNRAVFKLTDEQLRRVDGDTPDRKQFITDVEFHFQRTRPTQLYLNQNPNIMVIMGKEAAQDRK